MKAKAKAVARQDRSFAKAIQARRCGSDVGEGDRSKLPPEFRSDSIVRPQLAVFMAQAQKK
jgi:hypothetical protein